jgi:hypothetical protein
MDKKTIRKSLFIEILLELALHNICSGLVGNVELKLQHPAKVERLRLINKLSMISFCCITTTFFLKKDAKYEMCTREARHVEGRKRQQR